MRELNEVARDRMRDAGDLGEDMRVTVERGERNFAAGHRVMFLQNERGLGVKNGTPGTIEQVSATSMTMQTDDGRSVAFDLKDYNRIDHGYAATTFPRQMKISANGAGWHESDINHWIAYPGGDDAAAIARQIIDIIKSHLIVDIWSNEVAQNNLRNAIDDYFFDVLRDERGVDLPVEVLDDLELKIMDLARARFAA